MGLQVARETAKALAENRDIDPPDKLVPVVDIEDENPGAVRATLLLSAVGRAQVEVPFRLGLAERNERGEEKGQVLHGGIILLPAAHRINSPQEGNLRAGFALGGDLVREGAQVRPA